MKFNSTTILTVGLLVMMSGAGIVSGVWGYTLGHEALKGVSQPDNSPSQKLTEKNKGNEEELKILLDEQDLLKDAKAIMSGQVKPEEIEKEKEAAEETAASDTTDAENAEESKDEESSEDSASDLPIKGTDKKVTLEVVDAKEEGGSLLLDVNLKNDSDDEVRFLYSFLEVRDDQGRALSAVTDGLPGELPANGEAFSGTVKIPSALLTESKALSISLTDYPDRNLELNLEDIPIVR